MLFSGRQLDAVRAQEIGLVNEVIPAGEVLARTSTFASTVASRSQVAVRGTKRVVGLVLQGYAEDTAETERLRSDAFHSADYREGVRAFLEKRRPSFPLSWAIAARETDGCADPSLR